MRVLEGHILIGRKEIANYANVSVWTVSAMVKAGLNCSGGKKKGKPPITTKQAVDEFLIDNKNFVARKYHIKEL
tara:strand:- start:1497 stop:1718 length:222 start_codon:yes stop_codon:yes gene_type:complete